jgi:isocitrate dehydrogenase
MSFGMVKESANVWMAMQAVFAQGHSTPDLSKSTDEVKLITTSAFGDLVASELQKIPRVS